MSLISFSSLKGGVGKTSLSINVAHSLAKAGYQTLLVDLDPTSHSTRTFLGASGRSDGTSHSSPLARFFMSRNPYTRGSLVKDLVNSKVKPTLGVRKNLDLLPSGSELRSCFWGLGAKNVAANFGRLLVELQDYYDVIICDTAPDVNVVTRSALSVSQIVAVPVDSSAMSIDSLEQILDAMSGVDSIQWCIVRTMVNKRATSVQKHNEEFLETLISDGTKQEPSSHEQRGHVDEEDDSNPIYLLNSYIPRSEAQNKLTFERKTAFDTGGTQNLREGYNGVAKELLKLLASMKPVEVEEEKEDPFMSTPVLDLIAHPGNGINR